MQNFPRLLKKDDHDRGFILKFTGMWQCDACRHGNRCKHWMGKVGADILPALWEKSACVSETNPNGGRTM